MALLGVDQSAQMKIIWRRTLQSIGIGLSQVMQVLQIRLFLRAFAGSREYGRHRLELLFWRRHLNVH